MAGQQVLAAPPPHVSGCHRLSDQAAGAERRGGCVVRWRYLTQMMAASREGPAHCSRHPDSIIAAKRPQFFFTKVVEGQ